MAIYRVTTVFTGDPSSGPPFVNTLFFRADPTATFESVNESAGLFWAGTNSNRDDAVDFATDPEVARVDEITGQTEAVSAVTPITGAGGAASEPAPFATQGLMHVLTPFFEDGRRVRGRIFVPGVTEGDSTDGRPGTTYTTNLNDAGAGLINRAATHGQLVVWHRPVRDEDGNLVRNGGAFDVDSVTLWEKWAVLRSRRD